MAQLETTQRAPLEIGEDGVIRICGSRVTLDSIVHEFQRGSTAEQIQEDFPSVCLRDVYATIAYYLSRTSEVDAYLRGQQEAASETRQNIESRQDSTGIRARLRRRRAQ
jgi:uncharacterized protein (DUF433 family)